MFGLRKAMGKLLGAASLLLLLGCERETIGIHFVVPDNYRGTFAVIVDDAKGRKILPRDRAYTLDIPESGIRIVKRGVPFSKWHHESASYRNGVPIPDASSISSQAVAYHRVTTDFADGQEVHWFLIGIEREKQDALKKGFLYLPRGGVAWR
jgi:hypothetical protein